MKIRWLVLVCLGVVGCSSREAREEREVKVALDKLRESSAEDLAKRRLLIEALEKLPVSTPVARNARDACAKSYRLIVEGKELTRKLKADLDRTGKAPLNALTDLAAAEDKIKQSESALDDCQQAAVALVTARH